jgi:hypothetical protein
MCQDARRSLNFIVRFMPRFVPAGHGFAIALEAKDDVRPQQSELGFADHRPEHARRRNGHHLSRSSTRRARAAPAVERSELLGRALPHEGRPSSSPGDRPQSIRSHARGVGPTRELAQNRADDWLFTTADRSALAAPQSETASWPAR